MSEQKLKGISQAAREVPCAEGTLRDLEKRGLVSPLRDSAGRRLFGPEDVAAARRALGREEPAAA